MTLDTYKALHIVWCIIDNDTQLSDQSYSGVVEVLFFSFIELSVIKEIMLKALSKPYILSDVSLINR